MKKITKIFAVLFAVMLVAISLVACNGGKEYVFEAEEAELAEVCQVESGYEWGKGEMSDVEATLVGYFTAAGTTITFRITSDKECDATLTLRAASACHNMMAAFGGEDLEIEEIDLSKNECVKLTVNEQEAQLNGKLPGLTMTPPEGGLFGWMMDGTWGAMMKNCGTGTAKIHLVEGENVIVLTAQGYNGGQGGINVDKIIIKANATLTWEPTDNSTPAQ